MALTKATYSMIQGAAANVLDFGADPTGATASSVAFQAAITSLASGGALYVPQGTYLLNVTNGVKIASNITMFGDGAASVIKFGTQDSLSADTKSNIVIQDIKFKSENARLYFKACTNVKLINCIGDGLRTTGGSLTQQGFWFAGCDDVLVQNPYLQNYANAIYFDKNVTVPCGTVRVQGGRIEHTTHGSLIQYPTGVYTVEAKYTYVDGVTFLNIKPSSDSTDPSPTGYGVYEGDGTDGNIEAVSVTNCTFIDNDGYTAFPMTGVLITVSKLGDVNGCLFTGAFRAFAYAARDQKIQNCIFKGAHVHTSATGGITGYKNVLVSNNIFQDIESYPLIVHHSFPSIESALVIGNTFQNCKYGALASFVDYQIFIGNKFIDCNTTASTADDTTKGAIVFYGPQQGLVDGNTVMNLTTGRSDYAVVSGATAHGIVVTANNYFKGMLIGPMLRPLTAPPTTYNWQVGASIYNWTPSAGGTPGWVCVTSGTPGTWKAMAALAA